MSRPLARTVLPPLLLLALLASTLLLAATPARAGTAPAERAGSTLVLVGFSGVRWADVGPQTPTLESFAEDGAIGTVAVRSVYTSACPGDGWLALSAGRRATDLDVTPTEHNSAACPELTDAVDGRVPAMAEYRRIADAGTFSAEPGLLGDALRGTSTVAIGPGAAIALAGRDGAVAAAEPRADSPAGLQEQVRRALASGAVVVAVDAGVVRDPENLPGREADPGRSRAAQVADVEQRLAAVRAAIASGADPDRTTLLAVSIADAGYTPHLQFAGATGPAPGGGRYDGLLDSRSTRQTGIVQTTDLPPTVLALALGSDNGIGGLVGAPVGSVDADLAPADRVEKVRDLDLAAQAIQPLVPPFVIAWVLSQIVLYVVATVLLRRRAGGGPRRRVLSALRVLAIVYGAVPAATFLANLLPWWRGGDGTGSHLLAITGAVGLFVAVITAVALGGPWRRHLLGPTAAVGAITAGVLAVDVATGSRLVTSSLIGLQPVVAGRFYGLGNAQFALFAVGVLLLTVAVADRLVARGRRREAAVVVAVLGIVATYVDGVVGADFGGVPAIVPAFGLLALQVAGVRLTVRRVLTLLVGTVLVISVIAVADWLRPVDDQTHLGRFVQTLVDGGAWQVVQRKAEQNLHILVGSWYTLVLPVVAVFIGVVLMRPRIVGVAALQRLYDLHPTMRQGSAALLVLIGIGFAANDSGTVIPAVGAMLAVPLIIAACAQLLRDQLPADEAPLPSATTHDRAGTGPTQE
ncbi:hypothetical protein ACFFKU_02430 [Kineococcus gynurae]|uniref:Alkaline phosphatase n=1 Tax=Kineococcus gynurae TaxID=452979 RepID=A0ABV5LSJ1_9ACTN